MSDRLACGSILTKQEVEYNKLLVYDVPTWLSSVLLQNISNMLKNDQDCRGVISSIPSAIAIFVSCSASSWCRCKKPLIWWKHSSHVLKFGEYGISKHAPQNGFHRSSMVKTTIIHNNTIPTFKNSASIFPL